MFWSVNNEFSEFILKDKIFIIYAIYISQYKSIWEIYVFTWNQTGHESGNYEYGNNELEFDRLLLTKVIHDFFR